MTRQILPPGLRGLEERAARIILRRKGRAKAIPAKALAALLGIRDERQARRIVERLVREHGFLILGANDEPGGYFVPSTWLEAQEAISKLRGHALKELARVSRLSGHARIEEMAGQMDLRGRRGA